MVGDRAKQLVHQHDIHHRDLVHDQHVCVQWIVLVVFEAHGFGVELEQSVDRLRLESGRFRQAFGRSARGGIRSYIETILRIRHPDVDISVSMVFLTTRPPEHGKGLKYSVISR